MKRSTSPRSLRAAWPAAAGLLLAGCPNAGLAPPLPGDGAFTPAPAAPAASALAASAAPGAAASAPAGAGVPASPGPAAPSAAPAAGPLPGGGARVILQGMVYNEQGAAVEGASVALRSLDAARPFSATVTTRAGSWVANGVPEGVQIEAVVSKAGWTRRTRVVALQAGSATRNVLNFGAAPGASGPDDTAGAAYFVSDYPELASAVPDAASVRAERLSYTLRFSEALDADSRQRVDEAFALDAPPAAAGLMPEGLSALERASRVVLKKGATFRNGRARLAFSWNEAGDALTVTLDAPLRRLEDDRLAYRFQLVRPEGAGLIEDASGNVLGLTAPAVGEAYFGVRKSSLVVAATDTTAALRWQATHQRTASFEVEKDEAAPVLQAVAVTSRTRADHGNGEFYQVELTFSEPMRVYPDEKGYAASLVALDNYVFAMSEKTLDGVDLAKGTPGAFDAATQTAAAFDATFARPQAAFQLVPDADPATPAATDVFVEPSDDSPNAVNVFVPKAALPPGLKHIKVLVRKAVVDPAGNGVSEANAKPATNTADNVVLGTF
ncbi:MAG: carboxypeptidase-like regulatory domain-containing protein [Candidatus Sericytochromatia bacterium]|nr:carboxypeptidase-like regulatory domain-containing protein [Candidatus Sericytochromatia bacterium]